MKEIDYGQTFLHNGKTYVVVNTLGKGPHCSFCDFWKDGECKADEDVPACKREPKAFVCIDKKNKKQFKS
ncbi:hypothetical protein [Parabacteroides sp. AM08-6]|uniref:hypothetical protein n=1 Tax=Parabacteroides sp. AM08-6 TaxID=2292053 RepID=UPI000EFF07CB|nr:hypothetical protein [Parabacteroides sp. AM08-6]RHJ80654.1 hypothetical protein DW103_12525 [Parabacteroides sp. AM08-6]